MGCVEDAFDNKQTGPKSTHPGGFQAVFCDGSLHWIDNDIGVGSGTINGYWEMLFLSQDGGAIAADPWPPEGMTEKEAWKLWQDRYHGR